MTQKVGCQPQAKYETRRIVVYRKLKIKERFMTNSGEKY